MRLGQLARKYDVSLQEIILYLKEIEPGHDALHSNSKLNEQTESLIAQRFELLFDEPEEQPEIVREEMPEAIQEESPEPEIIETEVVETEVIEVVESLVDENQSAAEEILANLPEVGDLIPDEMMSIPEVEDLNQDEEVSVPEVEVQGQKQEENQREESETIETDRLLELLESEETSIDLSKITLIKAPKKELGGLKVVGKIEIAEPKVEALEEKESEPEQPKLDSESLALRRQQREELREQRRLIARKKEEEHKARQEKRKRDNEERKRKAQKEAHYKSKLKKSTSPETKQRDKPQTQLPTPEVIEQRPKPKTQLGKFWRWLNT